MIDNVPLWLAASEDQNISKEYLDPLTVNQVEGKALENVLGSVYDRLINFSIENKPGNPPGINFKIAISFAFRKTYFKDAPISLVKQFIQYIVDFFSYRHSENYITNGFNVDLDKDTNDFVILIGLVEKL